MFINSLLNLVIMATFKQVVLPSVERNSRKGIVIPAISPVIEYLAPINLSKICAVVFG